MPCSRVYRVASWEASLESMLSPLIFDLGTWSLGVDSLSVGARARGVLQLLQRLSMAQDPKWNAHEWSAVAGGGSRLSGLITIGSS
jgi:hypothetical protein